MQSKNRKAAHRAARQLRAQRSVSRLEAKKFPTRLRNLAARCEIVPNREFLNWYIETIWAFEQRPGSATPTPRKGTGQGKGATQQAQEPGV